jgi:hypothetical protein
VVYSQTVNQQIIDTVEGTVLQGVQGTVNFGPEASELFALIGRFGEDQAAELESALHELEDDDARSSERLAAKQRIKMFLLNLSGKVGDAAVDVLKTYVEKRIGV